MKYFKILFIISLTISNCTKIKINPETLKENFYSNWEMYAGNPARANVYSGDISFPLKLLWKFEASSAVGNTILVINGVLYFTTMDGRLYALDIQTGQKIGHKNIGIDATCVYRDMSLIIAYRYGDVTLLKYDLTRARTAWKIDAGDIASEPLLLDNHIVVTALYNHIDLYNIQDGNRVWQTKTTDQIRSSPAFGVGIIVFGCDDGLVYAVNRLSGETLWKFKTNASVQATPVIRDTIVYIGSGDKNFYALNINTGKTVWNFSTGGQIVHSAAVNDDVVIFGSNDSHLYCLDRISSEKIWSFEAKGVISTSPLICHSKVFFGSLDYHYYALDLKTGQEMWKFKTKGRVRTAPVIWGNYLIGASENNNIYAFAANDSLAGPSQNKTAQYAN